MELVPDKGARPCICRAQKIRDARLARIPKKFMDVDIEKLKPIDRNQAKAVELVKAKPEDSFIFCGDFGCGKTHLLWTLYKAAVMRDVKHLVACKLVTLIDEYKTFISDSMAGKNNLQYPRLEAYQLREPGTKFSIFFDDLDKETPTEFVSKSVFDIADAIYENEHQIVTTTNLPIAELKDHFDRADERFGGGIVRRLIDNAHPVEMF